MNQEHAMEKYADLLVRVGANVQKDQPVYVDSPLEAAPFTRLLVKAAYAAGARVVYVEWHDEETTRIKYDMAPMEAFSEYPTWTAKGLDELADRGVAFIQIYAPNPELLAGVDPRKMAAYQRVAGEARKNFRKATLTGEISWLMASVPTRAWAAKVLPDVPEDRRIDELWELIFRANRLDEADPVAAWREHAARLDRRADYLNSKRYRKLHYSGGGTDLSVELPGEHFWVSAGSENRDGTIYIPNMPTEEVFTLPKKTGVNGTVASTRPLNYKGVLIDGFRLTFKDGKAVSFSAERGESSLKELLDTDEGARYLGEVALVPHHSPISDTGVIFYNTLYDENASCHVALGRAIELCIRGGQKMSDEEKARLGANDSLEHVDFMIGSAELDIDGETADGTREPIFRKGNWAFEA